MDTLPLHPKLVHLPIALAVLMPLISAGLLFAWWRDILPRRAWWLAAALQLALVAGALVARASGESDEERMEARVGEAAIEAHEEAAGVFTVAAVASLVVIGAAALIRTPRVARGVAAAGVATTLAVLALGYHVGQAGGALVYGAGGPGAVAGATAATGADGDGDDD